MGHIEYRDEHINSHSGQHDYELGLYIDDEIVGMVQYTLYDGEITVRDIIVRPEFRRQGHGSRMMKYIKQKHPEYEYTPSMKTDLGLKFQHKDVELKEVRKIVREVLRESVLSEIIESSFEAYHGSLNEIDRFSDSFVGGENASDAQGAGIYFATNPEDASYYGDNIYKVNIKGRFLDRNAPVDNVDPEEIVKLIKMKDEWELSAQDYSPDPEQGAYEAAQMAIEYNDDEAEVFQQIEADFYRYDSVDYVRNMTKLGYDGIIVDAPSDVPGDKHIIVFNPNAIELIEKVK